MSSLKDFFCDLGNKLFFSKKTSQATPPASTDAQSEQVLVHNAPETDASEKMEPYTPQFSWDDPLDNIIDETIRMLESENFVPIRTTRPLDAFTLTQMMGTDHTTEDSEEDVFGVAIAGHITFGNIKNSEATEAFLITIIKPPNNPTPDSVLLVAMPDARADEGISPYPPTLSLRDFLTRRQNKGTEDVFTSLPREATLKTYGNIKAKDFAMYL